MNNTKTILAAILIAATLVVAGTAATITTTQSAFAYFPKKDNKKDGGNNNGNTITAQICKQKAVQSGWDNDQEQECGNTICTHPGSGASCVSETEGAAVSPVGNQTGGGGGVCNSPLVLARIDGVTICVDPSTLIKPVDGKCAATLIAVTVDDTIIGCISLRDLSG
jgi:hypothetical protein